MTDEEKQKLLVGVWGHAYETTKDLNGVPVHLRTLYDGELKDSTHKAMQAGTLEEQLFEIKRWKLAYGLISVNEIELPGNPNANYSLIAGDGTYENRGWLNFYVEQLYDIFEEICDEERNLGEILKNSGGTQEATP